MSNAKVLNLMRDFSQLENIENSCSQLKKKNLIGVVAKEDVIQSITLIESNLQEFQGRLINCCTENGELLPRHIVIELTEFASFVHDKKLAFKQMTINDASHNISGQILLFVEGVGTFIQKLLNKN